MCVTQHAGVVDTYDNVTLKGKDEHVNVTQERREEQDYSANTCMLTCFHFSIQGSWSIEHQTLNLQELIWFVSSYYREAEPTPALLQFSVNKCPLEFCWVPREKWLSSCNKTCIVNLRDMGLHEDTLVDPLYNEIVMDTNLGGILELRGLGLFIPNPRPKMFKNGFSP